MTPLGLLLGALDPRRHRGLLPAYPFSVARRLRNSEIVIFCAFVLFGAAWLPLQGIRDPRPIWEDAVRPHPEIRATFAIIQSAGLIAFLAVAAGGAPLLVVLAIRAIRDRRRDVLLPLAVPVIAAALLVGYSLPASAIWAQRQTPARDAPLTPLAVVLQLGFVAFVGLAIIGGVAGVVVAVVRSDPDERMARYAFLPAAVVTLVMACGSLATLVLCSLTLLEAPPLRSSGDLPVILIMGSAVALATRALRCGRGARAAQGTLTD